MNPATDNSMDRCPVMSGLRGTSPSEDSTQITSAGTVTISKPQVSASRLKRFALAALGVGFVFLAAVGVLLPGIPATGPLILASICLTKSCPWLEQRLVRSRFFAPFHRYLDGNAEMPLKARLVAMVMMWACIAISSLVLLRSDAAITKWLVAGMVLSGLLGTAVIARYRRQRVAGNEPSKSCRL